MEKSSVFSDQRGENAQTFGHKIVSTVMYSSTKFNTMNAFLSFYSRQGFEFSDCSSFPLHTYHE